ncbi:hypothetical protein OSB04_un001767 [Centaurea solstitialis]|uniref:Reverse transcriptase domain-containing protein n=1 Tax=Centaurea solstitialis TaxID=347529 RepID=A0AA38S3I8_9ASTR|nr:hypothetical protein OSB04_un001767 [Centaurea solstitialis]
MSFVYADNRGTERRLLWSGLRKFRAILGAKPWIIMGDFNCLLFPHDAFGGSSRRNGDMVDFACCLEDVEVFDACFTGIHYTWCQKPKTDSGLKRKLDRILVNTEFTELYRDVGARFAPRGLSDHSPGVVSFKEGKRVIKSGFKFDNFLTDDPLFLPTVQQGWLTEVEGTFMFRVTSKLKALKSPLRKLRSSYGNLSATSSRLKDELDVAQLAADLDPSNQVLGSDVARLRDLYQKSCWVDFSAARQRAKVKWLTDGDANTKFFHRVIQERRHSRYLHSVSNSQGVFVYDDEVATAFIEHFVSIIGTVDADVTPVMVDSLFVNRLTLEESNHMIRPILDDDIRRAIFSIGNDKSPGSDGFSAKFFKASWNIISSDVLLAIHNFFYRGRIAKEMLAARFFTIGKRSPRCAFKIDLRKAYDMVSWDYLFCMLEGFNFHPVLVKWIREMVSTVSFSVVVNGESRGYFPGRRGIRQGDPLSPYLFTLVMEGFSLLFKQCISEAGSFGYHHGCQDLELTHLCFADDLFVFTRGDVQSVEVLKKALSLFASRSGLAPNLQKSDIFFGNVAPNVREVILHCLPFRSGTFPIRYLGVPLSPVVLRPVDFSPLITRVRLRIQNWKSKFLSFGGRKQLVSSVLQSLQLYWMAVFLIPSGVVHEIEKLLRNFIWTQGEPSVGKCKVAWDMVCRPLENGGLGFRRLALWNRALLMKNLWFILTNKDCLWVSWVRSYALRNAFFWTAKRTTRWSWVLAKIMSLRTDIRNFVSIRVGDGLTTNAWEDAWLPCGRLSAFIPYRFIHMEGFSVDTKVMDLVDTFTNGWPELWKDRFPVLSSSPLPVLQHGVSDDYFWDLDGNGNGVCSVHNVYMSLAGQMPVIPWWKAVWFKGHIPKHSFCLWTACLKRLPTLDRVWLLVMKEVDLVGFPCSWMHIVEAISDQARRPKMMAQCLVLAAAVYIIWCERNQRIFRDTSKPVPHLVQMIMTATLDRLAWKRRKKKTMIIQHFAGLEFCRTSFVSGVVGLYLDFGFFPVFIKLPVFIQKKKQQTALQQRAIQEQRSQSHLVTHTEFQQFQASLDASLTKTFTEINKMFTEGLSQLSDRIRGVEETCQAAARRPIRRHDDHDDHDRHEGERKRRRLESEPSRAPTTSGVRIVDRFEERPPREKQPTRHRDSIVLAGGEEMETEEPRCQERVEESRVKFSGASSSLSEIDRVLALLDNVASELRDYQVPNEEINDARCAEDIRLKDMFDDVEFDFEKEKPVDDVEGPSLEEVLPQDDLMPVDPKKVELWEKMKASSGKFLKRTEWDRFTRATGKYLEERYKSRFCYHERKLSYTKLYGIENLKKELRTEYIHMRRVNRQRKEMLVSNHKFVSVTSYKTGKLSAYLYPVITFRRDDGKEYTITEADFQDVSFDVILGILYDLKGKSFRTEEEIIALTAIVRHVKVSISLAHLYDFQLGLENWTSKLFCHKPRRNLIGDEKDLVMYTVFYDAEETEISCVYPDSMGNKKRMYSHEVMLYSDDTLKMVMDNLNLRLQMDSHNVHDISAANKVLIRHFVSEIDRRLRLRVDIRFAEIKFKLRKPSVK